MVIGGVELSIDVFGQGQTNAIGKGDFLLVPKLQLGNAIPGSSSFRIMRAQAGARVRGNQRMNVTAGKFGIPTSASSS
uniref:Uncharacterized protein n=1 Tax=Candidatus Kentrum sp. DK TaxID=2126562 RepID=A0A450T2S1_9GAMM|nr:MAG: hypothetical protein BECKDK2373C_GA0170839_108312 [Candidatus Kentron sp. DK]